MFDLSNLNDYEFELLCHDIMQKYLHTKLYTFARGIDEGIDICDKEKNPHVVIQVKHYSGSHYSQFKASMKKEIEKMKKHNPPKYYICTSLSLTKKNKNELVDMFSDYMVDTSHVFDKSDINDFLEQEENRDVVLRNYKLWLCASNVLSLINNQNVFIDCSELMLDIDAQVKLFVETAAYREAISRLQKDNIIIIVGAPGVGKSTISRMLLLYYASRGYTVRFVTNNNMSDIKKTLSTDLRKKEVILLDDFLGQHYLNLKDAQPNELKTLVSFVEKNKSKKLILNSRITILNEAMQTFLTFKQLMETHESNKYLLDLDKMSIYEKAEIFYNHMYFNTISREYFLNIKTNKNYFKVIKHKNYNPRIIEYVTQKRNYENLAPNEYISFIMMKLDNPEDVWKDEFRNRLDVRDRVLMNTLYSLSDTLVDSAVLEKAFNKRMKNDSAIDTSINQYKDTIVRLTDSLIKNIVDKGKPKLSVVNPSINDYLSVELSSNTNELITIIDTAVYFEQIIKVAQTEESKEYLKQKLIIDDLLKLQTLGNSVFYYFLRSVVILNILDKRLIGKVNISLERAYENLNYIDKDDYGDLIFELFTGKFREFYELKNIFISPDKMLFILKPMHFNDITRLLDAIIDAQAIPDNHDLINVYKELFVEKITDIVQEELSDRLSDIASTVIRRADDEDIGHYMDDASTYLEDAVWDIAQDAAAELIEEKLAKIDDSVNINIDDFDLPEMRYYLEISDSLNAILNEPDYDKDEYRGASNGNSEDSIIISMFER